MNLYESVIFSLLRMQMECTMEPISSCCRRQLSWTEKDVKTESYDRLILSNLLQNLRLKCCLHTLTYPLKPAWLMCHDHSPVANTLLWNEDVTRDYVHEWVQTMAKTNLPEPNILVANQNHPKSGGFSTNNGQFRGQISTPYRSIILIATIYI